MRCSWILSIKQLLGLWKVLEVVQKFLDRVWNLQTILIDGNEYSAKFEQMMHRAIKKVSSDIEDMKFNTCISTFYDNG